MAVSRKYSGFPDIDAAAPDVYETPELTDDISTARGTSARSPSIDSDHDEDTSENENGIKSTIDKRHVKADQARSRFKPSRVNADDVDFSDRLKINQRSYKTYANRRRREAYRDDIEETRDSSDEEDESVDCKLAKLRRNVEQLKTDLDEQISKPNKNDEHVTALQSIEEISNEIDRIYAKRGLGKKSAEVEFPQAIAKFASSSSKLYKEYPIENKRESQEANIENDLETPRILFKTADFDARLSFLESSLGLSESSTVELASGSRSAILPTLISLEKSIQAASVPPSTVDSSQSRTKQLLKDAEKLYRLRSEEHSENSGEVEKELGLNSQQASKINALYGLLPVIDSISPSLPLVLDRLRSLQLLHTNAADASGVLNAIEKRYDEQNQEIKAWRQALEQVEANLEDNEAALADNIKRMGSWIRELETRASNHS